jgi:hypothetical protein
MREYQTDSRGRTDCDFSRDRDLHVHDWDSHEHEHLDALLQAVHLSAPMSENEAHSARERREAKGGER